MPRPWQRMRNLVLTPSERGKATLKLRCKRLKLKRQKPVTLQKQQLGCALLLRRTKTMLSSSKPLSTPRKPSLTMPRPRLPRLLRPATLDSQTRMPSMVLLRLFNNPRQIAKHKFKLPRLLPITSKLNSLTRPTRSTRQNNQCQTLKLLAPSSMSLELLQTSFQE